MYAVDENDKYVDRGDINITLCMGTLVKVYKSVFVEVEGLQEFFCKSKR